MRTTWSGARLRLLGEHHGESLVVDGARPQTDPGRRRPRRRQHGRLRRPWWAPTRSSSCTPRSSELVELASQLGSDVPFCMLGGTALGSGRGERVAPVMTRGQYWWVLVPGRRWPVDTAGLRESSTGCAASRARTVRQSPSYPTSSWRRSPPVTRTGSEWCWRTTSSRAAILAAPRARWQLLDAGRDATACGQPWSAAVGRPPSSSAKDPTTPSRCVHVLEYTSRVARRLRSPTAPRTAPASPHCTAC